MISLLNRVCFQAAHPAIGLRILRHYTKCPRIRVGYGLKPLVTDEDYQTSEEDDKLHELSFEKIRFARLWETNSPLYDSLHERFVDFAMKHGKKELLYDLMDQTFYYIKSYQIRKLRKDIAKAKAEGHEQLPDVEVNPMTILKQAIENCKPLVTTKKVKRGGAVYQVPFPIVEKQSEYLAIKWIQAAVDDRPKPKMRSYSEAMARELIDAANNTGKVIKRRDDLHRLADANKAYSHYRWS